MLKLEHHPIPRPAKGLTAYDFVKVGFFLFGFPRNAFMSVDVTDRCNLRCRHCYFLEQDCAGSGELSLEQWLQRFGELRRQGPLRYPFLQCTWVGGEPLLRKDVIARCKSLFRYNTIVTNGTLALPDWPDCHFFVSIDGTEALHDQLRGRPGLYQRAKRHANRPDLDVTIACCITRDNYESIEAMVKEWNQVEGVSQMTFDFYTPIESIDEPLWLDWPLRDQVIDQLIELKRIYGSFIITPEPAFRMMKSDLAHRVTRSCLFVDRATSFDPKGQVKQKCMLGPKADCDRCGCVVPFYIQSLVDRPFIVQYYAQRLRDPELRKRARDWLQRRRADRQ